MTSVSIYCNLIKYKVKQKHLIPFYITNNELKKVDSKDELKEIDIKNRTCYYFDDIMRVIDINFSNILLNEKSCKTYKNILIYHISKHGVLVSIK